MIVVSVVRPQKMEKLLENIPIKENSGVCKENEADQIQEVGFTVSLLCPLSCLRIEVPGRGVKCSHVQCFDLSSYIAYCNHRHSWNCPICNLSTPFVELFKDNFFLSILNQIDPECPHAVVMPNGSFLPKYPDTIAQRKSSKSLFLPFFKFFHFSQNLFYLAERKEPENSITLDFPTNEEEGSKKRISGVKEVNKNIEEGKSFEEPKTAEARNEDKEKGKGKDLTLKGTSIDDAIEL